VEHSIGKQKIVTGQTCVESFLTDCAWSGLTDRCCDPLVRSPEESLAMED
jgi:hypothetical protein